MSGRFYKREELEGKLVVDQEARIVGKVEDLAITEDGQVGISVKNEEGDEKLLRLDEIKKIADVILLAAEGETVDPEPETRAPEPENVTPEPEVNAPEPEPEPEEKVEEALEANVCSSCGWENRPDLKFCVKCGTQLG